MSMEGLGKRSRKSDRRLRREAKRHPVPSLAQAFAEAIPETVTHYPQSPAGGVMGHRIEALCGELIPAGANRLDCRPPLVTCGRCLGALRRRRSA